MLGFKPRISGVGRTALPTEPPPLPFACPVKTKTHCPEWIIDKNDLLTSIFLNLLSLLMHSEKCVYEVFEIPLVQFLQSTFYETTSWSLKPRL